MKLTVNGKDHEHKGDGTIGALLAELGAKPQLTAVMVNDDVVPAPEWPDVALRPGDDVELLVFACGG